MATNSSRWTRYIFLSLFLLIVVWLILPDERKAFTVGDVGDFIQDKYHQLRPGSEETSSSKSSSRPGPISTTSTPLTSKYCTKPYADRPLIQYALMMDAGSTGSRIHVYKFNYCQKSPQLEDEVYDHLKPGLSKFADSPQKAAESLDPLLRTALESVPSSLHHCTPIALKATAGLRMIGEQKSAKILSAVRDRLENDYPFPIWEQDGVAIMDGKDEGVYAWITVNYLLDNLGSDKKMPTAAVMDLGGGSTQIVFEPAFDNDAQLEEGDHKYVLDFGGFHYVLYQHSYLYYGLKEARKNVHRLVAAKYRDSHPSLRAWNQAAVPHPCLLKGVTKDVEMDIPFSADDLTSTGPAQTVSFRGTGAGGALCREIAAETLNKTQMCAVPPCSFNGVYQPPISQTFASTSDLYAFSYFYDRTAPLGMPADFRLDELLDMTHAVCAGEWDKFAHLDPAVLADIQAKEAYCLDLSYIFSLLRDGYEIDMHRMIRTAKKIRDAETGWALGASLALLSWYSDAGTCKITEVH